MQIFSWLRGCAARLLTRPLRRRRLTPVRRQTQLLLEPLENRILMSVITWTGKGDDLTWFSAANWSTGTVPGTADTAIINQPGLTVQYSGQTTSIQAIVSTATLDITSGGLTVTDGTSSLTGGLTVASGASLTAQGLGTTLTATGGTTINGANLYANSGATLSLPEATGYALPSGGNAQLFATGVGSTLSLPNLTTIGTLTNWLYIEASQGGHIALPILNSVPNSYPVVFSADGNGSQLDLSALPTFTGYQTGYSALTVTDGATLLAPNLSSFTGVNITLDGTGAIATSQWQSLNDVSLTVNGGSYTLAGVNTLLAPSLYVNNSARLTLPAVSTITTPSGENSGHLYATGFGSTLNLPNLTTVGSLANWLYIEASQGGQISLPLLNSVTNTYPTVFNVQARRQRQSTESSRSPDQLPGLHQTGYSSLTVTDGTLGTGPSANDLHRR